MKSLPFIDTVVITVLRKHEIDCYRQLDFPCIKLFRSFMVSFKYGLVLLRYSSIDQGLILFPLLSYSI